jgi:hypothetical protein
MKPEEVKVTKCPPGRAWGAVDGKWWKARGSYASPGRRIGNDYRRISITQKPREEATNE